MLARIKQLRKELHKHPELSGQERQTAHRIRAFIKDNSDAEIIENIGGNGLAVVYAYSDKGPTVVIRCELDALPIKEVNTFDYKSVTKGVSHKCGHDGHMAIVAGLIFRITKQSFPSGKIVLLFQPAEETGHGAYTVINDKKFKALNPDYIFALHNIPGEPLNTVLVVKKHFSATVQGLAIYLTGKVSHASEPENGINPALAIATIISELSTLNVKDTHNKKFALLTPVHLNIGQQNYGISPGSGELHYTLRTWTDSEMERLKARVSTILNRICEMYKLQYTTAWVDYFPTVINNSSCNELIVKAAKTNGFELKEQPHPFKFGEDFGWFSKTYKTAMFGLGAGIASPALHNADYDFPDKSLKTGMSMFTSILEQLLG